MTDGRGAERTPRPYQGVAGPAGTGMRRPARPATLVRSVGWAALCLLAAAASAQSAPLPPDLARRAGSDWPRFLGPANDGKSPEAIGLRVWPPEGPPVVWQRAVGEGYSMPVVARGRLFVFDRVGDQARLVAVNAETGAELWRAEYPTAYEDMYGYSGGPRASPLVDDDRVYVYGAEGRLRAHRAADGALLWEVDTAARYRVEQNFFGVASSPVVFGDLLLVMVGGSPPDTSGIQSGRVAPDGSAIVAFDKRTGAERYRVGDELASYAGVVVAPVAGRMLGLAFLRGGLLGFEPERGRARFHFPWRAPLLESVNAANPVVAGDQVFLTETYGPGGVLLQLRPDGYDVVWRDGRRERSLAAHWSTPIHHQGVLYGSSGRHSADAELRAVEWATGRVLWTRRGLSRATLLYADGCLVVLTEYGRLLLIEATGEAFRPLADSDLARRSAERPPIRNPAWAPPILARGLLYVRGKDALVAFDLGRPSPRDRGQARDDGPSQAQAQAQGDRFDVARALEPAGNAEGAEDAQLEAAAVEELLIRDVVEVEVGAAALLERDLAVPGAQAGADEQPTAAGERQLGHQGDRIGGGFRAHRHRLDVGRDAQHAARAAAAGGGAEVVVGAFDREVLVEAEAGAVGARVVVAVEDGVEAVAQVGADVAGAVFDGEVDAAVGLGSGGSGEEEEEGEGKEPGLDRQGQGRQRRRWQELGAGSSDGHAVFLGGSCCRPGPAELAKRRTWSLRPEHRAGYLDPSLPLRMTDGVPNPRRLAYPSRARPRPPRDKPVHRAYSNRTQQLQPFSAAGMAAISDDIIWIDLDHPTVDEERTVERCLGIELPTPDEMKDIEPSSRLYQEDGASYMTASVLWRADTEQPETTAVGFILHQNRLVTIRYAEPKPFRAFAAHAERERTVLSSGAATLAALLEAMVDRTAEILERTGAQVDEISRRIFQRRHDRRRRRSSEELEQAMADIAFHQNVTAKSRDSLVSLGRMVSFAMLAPELVADSETREHLKTVSRDISSLTDHASFLANYVSFLGDAALGLIHVEQNQIIKIFSVAAVIFLPPTLVASSYGMNFKHMPELGWLLGYPTAIGLMIVSAVIPYLLFKRRGLL